MRIGEATRPLGDQSQAGGHCLKVWTKKQQVVALSSAESELHAAVKTASEGLGRGKGPGHIVWAEPTLGRLGNDGLGQSQRAGQSQTRRPCRICGCRRHPSQAGSSRRRSARA